MIFNRPIPLRVPGCKLWLDASTLRSLYTDSARTTPVAANDDPVGALSDLSGNGYHATQATSSKRPLYKASGINSMPSVQTDGVDDYLEFTNPISGLTAYTLFLVAKYDVASGYVYDMNGGLDHAMYCNGSAIINWNTTTLTTTNLTTAFLYTKFYAQSDTPDESFRWNRSDVAGTSSYSAGSGPARIGTISSGGFYGQIKLAEMIVYNSKLSATQYGAVESYLHGKWGVG